MTTSLFIREPKPEDENVFIDAMTRSKELHTPWVAAPCSATSFQDYVNRARQANQQYYFLCDNDNIAGVFNVSEIVRGFFQNAYFGFYAVAEYAGKGVMSAGLKLVLKEVFTKLKLHRLEANIQPQNTSSIHLVEANGFRKEGFSPRYLKIDGEWRDHERWAITYEDWVATCQLK
jgi:ribosomal-protein-alanine N-acetyltransferase